jgi:hypothetical protein
MRMRDNAAVQQRMRDREETLTVLKKFVAK